MADSATIFIPDISGYSEFASRTALDHSAHIVNELLEVIIESDELGLTVSEIEGDAVLFYALGAPIAQAAILDQCTRMFRNFHNRLKIIERDAICQCGACQSASNLSLKFVVHYGPIKEISISRLTRATGVDLIIAHRLLKNRVPSREYILASQDYRRACGAGDDPEFAWTPDSEVYPGVGQVDFAYTVLDDLRADIPPAPKRDHPVVSAGGRRISMDIGSPLLDVYQSVVDLDSFTKWQTELLRVTRDPVTERIGMRHDCFFPGLTLSITTEDARFDGAGATIVESVFCQEFAIGWRLTSILESVGPDSTRLEMAMDFGDTAVPDGFESQALAGLARTLEMLKTYCESRPPPVL